MSPGERYILFLSNDGRLGLPFGNAGIRCQVTGIWAGKFRVENGRIAPSPDTSAEIRKHENQAVADFLETLLANR